MNYLKRKFWPKNERVGFIEFKQNQKRAPKKVLIIRLCVCDQWAKPDISSGTLFYYTYHKVHKLSHF